MCKHYALRIIAACLLLGVGSRGAYADAGQLAVSEPRQPAVSTGKFTVAGNASEFRNVEVWFDGAELARATPSASGAFNMQVDTSAISDGTHLFIVNAWNSPPHTPFTLHAETSLAVTVANAGRQALTIASPAPHASVGNRVILSGNAAGFMNVEVSFNGILLARAIPAASGVFRAAFNTLSLPDGEQKLTVEAWNSPAGQPYTAKSRTDCVVNIGNGSINIMDYGAIADGVTDNTSAIVAAIADAHARGVAVFVPAGRFAYGEVLRLTGVKLFGVGSESVLYALNWAAESLFLYGDGSEVRQLTLSGVAAPARVAPWEATRIALFGASDFVIDHVNIAGSAAAGIQTAMGSNHGVISNNHISNTLSDSVHMTGMATDILVENNLIEFSGDDGIAVVSYALDGGYSGNITARNNVVVHNIGGRAMSVVGGKNVAYVNNLLEDDAAAACLYVAQEGGWNTLGVENFTAQNNTLSSCGNPAIGHGAVMVVTTGARTNSGIRVLANAIDSGGAAGIRVFGSNVNVALKDNQVDAADPAYDIEDAGVVFVPYTAGTVGRTVPPSLPIT